MSARRLPARPTHAPSDQLAASVSGILLAGPLLYTGIGWAIDRWLHTGPLGTVLGLLLGTGLSIYLVWIRYGTSRQVTAATQPRSAAYGASPASADRRPASTTTADEENL